MTGRITLAALTIAVLSLRGGRTAVAQGLASAASEARAIAASNGAVSRRGDTLTIRISGRAPLRFINRQADPTATIDFTYDGTVPASALHVVRVHYYETGDVLTVDGVTGDTAHMVDRPVVSPSGRFAAATTYDMSGIGEAVNAIQVWQLRPAPAREVWSLQMLPPDTVGLWGASIAGWSGDSIVRLVRHIVVPGKQNGQGDYPERRAPARLVRLDTTWRLDTLPR